jgi:hypothetical protein
MLILGLVLAGCAGTPSGSLRISLRTANAVGNRVHWTTWTLHCNPDSGSAPSPRKICAALRQDHELLDAKQHGAHSCPFGVPIVFIRGTYDDTHVFRAFTPCAYGAIGVEDKWLKLLRTR